ncbi:MAG: hypothetical protein AAGU26_08265 [bacterium]
MQHYIIVVGYGWSGSSAIVDLLKEFRNVAIPEIEFRLIKDPYGISNLENNLMNEWDFINSDAAINDFLWLVKKCSKNCNHFYSPIGLNYKKKLNRNIEKLTEEYIKSIVDFEYIGNNYHREFKKPYLRSVLRRLSIPISRKTNNLINIPYREEKIYFSKPSYEIFLKATQKYIHDLFKPYFKKHEIVVLDQAISPLHPDSMKYFENAKMIIVDRNACDIYIDLKKNQSLIGLALNKDIKADKYINWHKKIRNISCNSENILNIKFEDLIIKYEETIKNIIKFIGWDLGEHNYKKYYFDPKYSIKNVNLPIGEYCSKDQIVQIKKEIH